MTDNVAELIERVFCTRTLSHKAHLTTRSYAEHMALGDFYEDIIEVTDKFTECYQGAFGLLKFKEEKENTEEEEDKDILKTLQEDVKWITKNRSTLSKDVSVLQNILDEIVAVYLQTIYKLRFLS